MKHSNFTNLKTKFAGAKFALLLAASFLAGTFATRPGSTQTPPATPKYAVIEFLKAEPGKGADYVKAEREWWMPAHQEMVKQGRLKSWQLYGVRGSGTAMPYTHVVIRSFDKWQDLESPGLAAVMEKVHPGQYADFQARTSALRQYTRSETLTLIAQTQ